MVYLCHYGMYICYHQDFYQGYSSAVQWGWCVCVCVCKCLLLAHGDTNARRPTLLLVAKVQPTASLGCQRALACPLRAPRCAPFAPSLPSTSSHSAPPRPPRSTFPRCTAPSATARCASTCSPSPPWTCTPWQQPSTRQWGESLVYTCVVGLRLTKREFAVECLSLVCLVSYTQRQMTAAFILPDKDHLAAASSLCVPLSDLERQLAGLIMDGAISARIDSATKVRFALTAPSA